MKAILIAAILLTMAQAETVTCERDGRDTFTCETESDPYRGADRREERRAREEHRQNMEFYARQAADLAEEALYAAEFRALESE